MTQALTKQAQRNFFFPLFASLTAYFWAVYYAYTQFMLTRWGEDFAQTSWGINSVTENSLSLVFFAFLFTALLFASLFQNKPSDFLHLIFLCAPLTPMLVISGVKGAGVSFALFGIVSFFVSFFVSRLSFRVPCPKFTEVITPRLMTNLSIVLGILIVLWCIAVGGLQYFNISFDEVYQYRRGASDTRGTLLNYLILNYVGIIIPLGFVCAYIEKRYVSILMLFIISFFIFGLTSNKLYLFMGLFVIPVFIMQKRIHGAALFAIALSIVCAGSTFLYNMMPAMDVPGNLFVRRFIFVPANLNLIYWDFFSLNPHSFWSGSKVSFGLVEPVYHIPVPQVIANTYSGVDMLGRVDRFNNANTGWIGSGFGHAGYIGILIYAVFSGLITKYANAFGRMVGNEVATAALSFYFFTVFFASSDMPTALLSYGFFALIGVMSVWKPQPQPHPSAA